MNQHLLNIMNLLQQDKTLSDEEKNAIIKSLKDADKEFEITSFKLNRTEKVKRTTAILLEETIEELEQKRKAVEAQNKELEIESSLERVRTQVMSMSKPDDLMDICEVMFKELSALGFDELRNAMINIYPDDKPAFLNYDYAINSGKTVTSIPNDFRPLVTKQISTTKNAKDAFYEMSFTGQELKDFRELRKNNGELDDPRLEETNSLHYHFYSIGTGSIGISTYSAITENKLELLKRFRNVFDFAYRRYVDVAQAEAQAQGAKIEASLERIRSVAMGLRRSEELVSVCESMYKELFVLGFTNIRNAQIAINNDAKQAYTGFEYSDHSRMAMKEVAYNSYPMMREVANEMKKSKSAFFQKEISGEEFKNWREWRKSFKEGDDPRVEAATSMCFYLFSIGKGLIGITTFNAIANEQVETLKRFRNVFELSYQRYTDVANAEAQAKEAQVELALERVRARTMAMQKSDELAETAYVLFQQFEQLGEDPEQLGIGIFNEKENILELWTTINGKMREKAVTVSLDEPVVMRKFYTAWKEDKKTFIIDISGKDLEQYNNYRKSLSTVELESQRIKDRRVISIAYFSKGAISLATSEPRPPETLQLLERFANVFDLTYTRFLDLKKAEAQSRESQIQLALERGRTQSMIMQHSKELDDTLRVFHEQVLLLGINSAFSFLWLPDEEKSNHIFWAAWAEEKNDSTVFKSKAITYPLDRNEPATAQCLIDWKSGEPVFSYAVPPEGVKSYFAAWQELIDGVEKLTPEHFINGLYYAEAFMKYGCFGVILANDLNEDEKKILNRFAIEFERAYTRFLDLQKAEAQAREATIEMSLERVRAKTMAMHNSKDLKEVITLLSEQFLILGFNIHSANFNTSYRQKDWDLWLYTPGSPMVQDQIHIPYFDHPYFNRTIESLASGADFTAFVFTKEEKDRFLDHIYANTLAKHASEERKKYTYAGKGFAWSSLYLKNTAITIANYDAVPYSEDQNAILRRFGNVFEQTYTRFLDLQKSESQARESQIQLALERVRARTMAMQRSDELAETAVVLFQQFKELGQSAIQITIGVMNEEERQIQLQLTDWRGGGEKISRSFNISMDEPTVGKKMYAAWKAKQRSAVVDLTGKELHDWIAYRNAISGVIDNNLNVDKRRVISFGFFSRGAVSISTPELCPPDTIVLLERFAGVFDGSYTRFLDLQKSEAQAREAQIEASLERVRSKAMSMQKSEDLANTVAIVFEELDKLNLGMLRCGIGILNKEKRCAQVWTTTVSENNTVVQVSGEESMDIHPLLSGAFEAWIKQEDHSYILLGEDLNNYYKAVARENFKLPDSQSLISGAEGIKQYYYNAVWSSGGLFAFRETEFPEEAKVVLRRFADVFDFTYTRFNDLKQAEAQAKEAKIEVALERVRSRTLAMQKSDELAETAAVLFRQLISLGIAPNRLYIGIVKDEDAHIEFWVTDEDGSKVSTQFIGDANRNDSMKKMYDTWKEQQRSLTIDMQGKELKNYFHYLAEELKVPFKQGLEQKRRVQTVAYFGKGFIGMASPDDQPEETTLLLERFAAVFNLTYTRFNDLKVAEAHAIQAEEDLIKLQTEKKRAEDALTELRSTQTQLIQSEKMASLGELTAGIAHEIQNPLNFVNNFSEVSNELIEELKEERSKVEGERDRQLEEELLNDIKQNLEKINHHGKRADAIVKGMLQHSRATSATKEPTDISKLADEYLRLAYHGLRAKDKSFNATLKTDYDETLEQINIIPQDIGRVVLNLITNAFYAVTEKKKASTEKSSFENLTSLYEPTVTVSTKKLTHKILISVSDNGNGIPKNILDKIFQPFFTTKPTGQGTGLGLSLAYDIIKAHGGELKVETQENNGTTFIIQLPAI